MSVELMHTLIAALAAIAASSGFWMFISQRKGNKINSNRLLLGLAHDRIIYLAMSYVRRGFITKDEYETINEYLVKPYLDLGGNGTVSRLMKEVDKLPLVSQEYATEFREKENVHGQRQTSNSPSS